jgi:Holliday junction DNA helicase RuvA
MIVYVRGILTEKDPTRVVIEAAGVGYELLIPLSTYERLPREGAEVKLLAYHSVREDDEILFGFSSPQERELFTKLTGVSGVGPKIALAILSG